MGRIGSQRQHRRLVGPIAFGHGNWLGVAVPAVTGDMRPEVAFRRINVQTVPAQRTGKLCAAQIYGIFVKPLPVANEGQNGHRILWRVGAPAVVVGPDVPTIVDPTLLLPGRHDKYLGTRNDAGVVIVGGPSFWPFRKTILYHLHSLPYFLHGWPGLPAGIVQSDAEAGPGFSAFAEAQQKLCASDSPFII